VNTRKRRSHAHGGIATGVRDRHAASEAWRYTARRALEAGVLDELVIHPIPVLLGGGPRPFDLSPSRVELDIVRVIDAPEATHLDYRVRR